MKPDVTGFLKQRENRKKQRGEDVVMNRVRFVDELAVPGFLTQRESSEKSSDSMYCSGSHAFSIIRDKDGYWK
ncbi:hypothetical protein ABD76_16460 [Paenibacillus dendritiformis]|nr:hypothetical protein [Paenibacillus dendritiformis]